MSQLKKIPKISKAKIKGRVQVKKILARGAIKEKYSKLNNIIGKEANWEAIVKFNNEKINFTNFFNFKFLKLPSITGSLKFFKIGSR